MLKPISSITSCSPISYIVFSWLSPVLHRGAKLETLTQEDLPLLGANDRAPNLFDAIKDTEGSKGPSWMNGLLWRVLLVNKRLFAWRESTLVPLFVKAATDPYTPSESTLAGINAFL